MVANKKQLPGIAVEGLSLYDSGKTGFDAGHGAYQSAPMDRYLRAIFLGTSVSAGSNVRGSLRESGSAALEL